MGLGFVKIGVDAVVCEEGVVGSVFGDAAVVEDDDAVAEFAAAHAVGDVDSGFAGGHLAVQLTSEELALFKASCAVIREHVAKAEAM